MDRARRIAVACITLGTALVSVALGCLFIFMIRFSRAATELSRLPAGLDDSQEDMLLLDMLAGPEVAIAFVAGTLGSAMVAGSLLFALFQLPWLRPRIAEAPNP